jgi:cytidylate kinase
MKKRIITIAGFPGSGKSSTAKSVAQTLGYEHFSSGDLFRKMAAERGLTVEGINFAAEKQQALDYEVDELLQQFGTGKEKLVIDSRMAFHWIPDSFKVFLELDERVAAERTFVHIQQEGRTGQQGSSVEEIYENTKKRMESERKRYWDLYRVDYTDKSQFDLVIDTGRHGPGEVVNIIVAEYQKWLIAVD